MGYHKLDFLITRIEINMIQGCPVKTIIDHSFEFPHNVDF